jgi:hypothetical protein
LDAAVSGKQYSKSKHQLSGRQQVKERCGEDGRGVRQSMTGSGRSSQNVRPAPVARRPDGAMFKNTSEHIVTLATGLHDLWRLSDAQSRAITPENVTGGKGAGARATTGLGARAARDLGPGWKISPAVMVDAGQTVTLADIDGSGVIQHIWMTTDHLKWRSLILRFSWDDQAHPSVEVPLGDFFACGWGIYAPLSSLAVCVNPGRAFNCYWPMPFGSRARITLENRSERPAKLFYQIDYTQTAVSADAGRFHARFRRVNPLPYKDVFVILDDVAGRGHYVGTYMCWGSNSNGCWVEGEVKFYLDGDEHPTICATGTEDYFGGAYTFDPGRRDKRLTSAYAEFTTPYSGLSQVIRPDGVYRSQQRFGMYRWHVTDPIRFAEDIRVTIQALGWRDEDDLDNRRYLPLRDDIAATAFWYQSLPSRPLPPLQDRDDLDII